MNITISFTPETQAKIDKCRNELRAFLDQVEEEARRQGLIEQPPAPKDTTL